MPGTDRFRQLRILALLIVLLLVAADAVITRYRTTDWDRPLSVAVYPVNGDGSVAAARHIAALGESDLQAIERFFRREGRRFGLELEQPVTLKLRPPVNANPPPPPEARNIPAIMWWSLRLRYWAFVNADDNDGLPRDVRMFVRFFDREGTPALAHSLGLEKGLIGVVNVYAGRDMTARNNVVIAHELLHTVGATDKYEPSTNFPRYPHGYAAPDRVPLYPQASAEIMAGRIPLSPREAVPARSLREVRVGAKTAVEINWVR